MLLLLVLSNWRLCCAQEIKPISKRQFESGIRPASLDKRMVPKYSSKKGVKIEGCRMLENDPDDPNSQHYELLGVYERMNNIYWVLDGSYNGFTVIGVNKNNCMRYNINGMPLIYGDFVCCFNDERTTDLRDNFSVWQYDKGGLKMVKKYEINTENNHIDDKNGVRFSSDGKWVYYLTVSHGYVAMKIK